MNRRRALLTASQPSGGSGGGDCTIMYTSSDGNVIIPNYQNVFGANIISNTYVNGQGVITFDAPVTEIGDKAFENCKSLTSVTIGNSVTYIGFRAFSGCKSLTSIYFKATTPPIAQLEAFENNASSSKFYVPRNSVNAYKSAAGWSSYKYYVVGYDF